MRRRHRRELCSSRRRPPTNSADEAAIEVRWPLEEIGDVDELVPRRGRRELVFVLRQELTLVLGIHEEILAVEVHRGIPILRNCHQLSVVHGRQVPDTRHQLGNVGFRQELVHVHRAGAPDPKLVLAADEDDVVLARGADELGACALGLDVPRDRVEDDGDAGRLFKFGLRVLGGEVDSGPAVAMTLTSLHASAASARGAAVVSANAKASAETATELATVVCIVIVRPPVEWRRRPRGPG